MTINADSDPGYVGDDIEFTVQLPADATGNVTFQIRNAEGVEVNSQINLTNGRGTYLAIGGLVAGPHTITAVYSGNSKYPGTTVSRIYTVEKLPSSVNFDISDIHYGESFLAKAYANEGATGYISIRVYNNSMSQEVTNPIEGRYATAFFDNLPVGTYTLEATYLGDDKFKPSATLSDTFEVLP